MIVTRKCHRCGKKNRFDKTKIEDAVRCRRCNGRIRRTNQDIGFLESVLLNIKGYLVYNKAALLLIVVAGAVAGATYYFTRSRPEQVVDKSPPQKVATQSQVVSEPTPAELSAPVQSREPKRFAADLVWSDISQAPGRLDVGEDAKVTASAFPPAYIAVGGTVVDLKSGEKFGDYDTANAIRTALSSDGNWFAIATASEEQVRVAIHPTRNRGLSPVSVSIDCEASQLGMVAFTHRNRLVVQSNLLFGSKVSVWETNGSDVIEFETPAFQSGSYALAPESERMAIASASSIDIYELDTAKRISLMAAVQTGFPNSMCNGLAFSPDGQELAALLHLDRFVVWNSDSGAISVQHTFQRSVTAVEGRDDSLQWLPDGRGWLLNGSMLLLSEPLVVVWSAADPAVRHLGYVVDSNHLLLKESSAGQTILQPVAVPWSQIDQVRGSLPQPLLAAGHQVAVSVGTGNNDSHLDGRFANALEARCEDVGLVVSGDASVQLLLRYTEKRGTRKPFEGGEYLDEVGRVVHPTEFICECVLRVTGSSESLWSRDFSASAGIATATSVTAAELREKSIASVEAILGSLNIPSRVLDGEKVQLPLLRTGPAAATGD